MTALKYAAASAALLAVLPSPTTAAAQRGQDMVAVDVSPVIMEIYNNVQAYAVDQLRFTIMLKRADAAEVCGGRVTGSKCVAQRVTRALLRKSQDDLLNLGDSGGAN